MQQALLERQAPRRAPPTLPCTHSTRSVPCPGKQRPARAVPLVHDAPPCPPASHRRMPGGHTNTTLHTLTQAVPLARDRRAALQPHPPASAREPRTALPPTQPPTQVVPLVHDHHAALQAQTQRLASLPDQQAAGGGAGGEEDWRTAGGWEVGTRGVDCRAGVALASLPASPSARPSWQSLQFAAANARPSTPVGSQDDVGFRHRPARCVVRADRLAAACVGWSEGELDRSVGVRVCSCAAQRCVPPAARGTHQAAHASQQQPLCASPSPAAPRSPAAASHHQAARPHTAPERAKRGAVQRGARVPPHPACPAPRCPWAAPGSGRAWCPPPRCPRPGTRTARRPPAWRRPEPRTGAAVGLAGGRWHWRRRRRSRQAAAAVLGPAPAPLCGLGHTQACPADCHPPCGPPSPGPHLAPRRPGRAARRHRHLLAAASRGPLQLQAALVDEARGLQAQHGVVDAQRLRCCGQGGGEGAGSARERMASAGSGPHRVVDAQRCRAVSARARGTWMSARASTAAWEAQPRFGPDAGAGRQPRLPPADRWPTRRRRALREPSATSESSSAKGVRCSSPTNCDSWLWVRLTKMTCAGGAERAHERACVWPQEAGHDAGIPAAA